MVPSGGKNAMPGRNDDERENEGKSDAGAPPGYARLVEVSPLLRAEVRPDGVVSVISDGLLRAAGLRRADAAGLRFDALLTEESAEAAIDALALRVGGAEIFTLEASLRRAAGRPAPVLMTAMPLRVAGYPVSPADRDSVLITMQELEHSRVFRDALLARREAELESRRKAQLLAQISHEVRTPMNIIMGYIQLARMGDVGETEARHLDTALAAAETLMTQMSDMLDLSRIESGRVSLSVTPFDPRRWLSKIADQIRPRVEARGLAFLLELDPALPERALGDANRAAQILNNFLSNAIKFTESGTIALRARLLETNPQGWRLRFEVEDTGCGIAENDRRGLFDAFDRGAQTMHGSVEGWGLGLSICQAIAKLLDAEIGLRSEPGAGSCFHVDLNLKREAPPPPSAAKGDAAATSGGEGRSRKVLLVEDNRTNRHMLAEALSRGGHAVSTAADGAEAVRICESERFDIVLMDVRMPLLRGDEAARRIRRDGKNTTTPIVAVTANSRDDSGENYDPLAFDTVLLKPVNLAAIGALLDRLDDGLGLGAGAG